MDKISLHLNLFLQLQDKGTDITVIPLEISLEFLAKWKRGIGSKHGYTQDFKGELIDLSVKMIECQGVFGQQSGQQENEEDDDFEEDDDDDDDEIGGTKSSKKPKQSMFATLACSFMPKVNEMLNEGEIKE